MKLYTLINLGILASLGLTGCSEDKIVNTNPGVEEPELSDYTVKAKINDEAGIGLTWAAGDGFTLWNRNIGRGYAFNISENYDAANPSAEADFNGQAALQNNPQILAVYPKKDAKVLNDIIKVSIPDTCKTSEFNKYSYLTASTTVADGAIPDLSFSPKTARLNLKLHNISDTELKVAYVTLHGYSDVFPLSMDFTEAGEIGEIYNAANSVTIDMEEQTIPVGGSIDGYINVIPTSNGSTSFLKQSTSLDINVKLIQNGQPFDYTAWSGTIGELPLEGVDMLETSYQFYMGMNYPISVNVNDFSVPEEGYSADEEGNITIYNADGLKAWAENVSSFKNVTIDNRFIEDNTIEYEDNWQTVGQFDYTFNGNGVILKKVQGFIGTNNGTIKNLILEDNAITSSDAGSNAILVKQNNGTIENCNVKGNNTMNVSGSNGNSGIIAGVNGNGATISGCYVTSAAMTVSAKQNAGIIAGVNNGNIINCFVSSESKVTYSGTDDSANIGGVAGTNSGTITAVSSLVTINLDKAARAGGLVGESTNGQIGISYAIPVINNTASTNTVYGLIGNYTGGSIISCYSWTEGFGLAPAGTSCTESYYVGSSVETSAGTNVADAAGLQGKAAAMNLEVTGSNYKYVNGTETEPLVITSDNDGTEGPGMGDGGEI